MTIPTKYVMVVRPTETDSSTSASLDSVAREAGLHPALVQRLIALGALQPTTRARGVVLFPRDSAAQLARVIRLRNDLGLNYAGALLARQLLARIDELEELADRAGLPYRR